MPTNSDILAISGLSLITIGAGMIYVPAAFIMAGGILFTIAARNAEKGAS